MIGKSVLMGVAALSLAASGYAATQARKAGADANNDGSISSVESNAAAAARFAKMDANGDNKIDASDKDARLKARFASMDSDNNGLISEAEFIAGHKGGREKHGMRGHGGGHKGDRKMGLLNHDTNGDKAVSREEFMANAVARFGKADANSDGIISATEKQSLRAEKRAARKERRKDHRKEAAN